MKILFLLLTVMVLLGCSSKEFNKNVYDALIQRECIQKTGEPNCDFDQPSYEDYQRERSEINKQQ